MCSHYETQWARIGHYSFPQWVKTEDIVLKKTILFLKIAKLILQKKYYKKTF